MREILFKAKRLDNGKWVEGNLYQDKNLETVEITGFNYYCNGEGLQREPFSYLVLKKTVSQCTGLKDKNGYPIWENDVVWDEYDEEYLLIKYLEDNGLFAMVGHSFIMNFSDVDSEAVEVQGNIFDNPELV